MLLFLLSNYQQALKILQSFDTIEARFNKVTKEKDLTEIFTNKFK